MTQTGILHKYPKFYSWYNETSEEEANKQNQAEASILQLCQAIDTGEDNGKHFWWGILRQELSSQEDAQGHFLQMTEFCKNLGVDFPELLGVLTDLAIRQNQSAQICDDLSVSADLTSIATLRFLAAWSAFNNDDPQRCVDECTQIETPFAQVKGLMGQAQLELGDIKGAVASLKTAVALDDKELLSWFQLAKAHSLLEQPEEAWAALEQCEELSPNSQEVAVFMGLLVTKNDLDLQCAQTAFREMLRHTHGMTVNASFLSLLIQVGIETGNESNLESCLSTFDWASLSRTKEYIQVLPDILRALGDCNWMKTSKFILENTNIDG